MQNDELSVKEIKKYLNSGASFLDIELYGTVTSTNELLLEMAQHGAKEGKVIISSSQTNGRGRKGRSFYSPQNTGIYMSVLLNPGLSPKGLQLITAMAAVAACEAVEKVSHKKPLIKWVNDIYLDGKKICGILTQSSFSENNVDYVVMGIGINVYFPSEGFPGELENTASALFHERRMGLKSRIAAEFLNSFISIYKNNDRNFIRLYAEKSCVLNKNVTVIRGEEKIPAFALSIDEQCRLIVRYKNGMIDALNSGEISIKA